MARIRTIKPDFFKSEDTATLPIRARLLWIGLWTQCDDHGRYKDSARLLKGDLFSLEDVTLRDIEEDLNLLAESGRIVRYTASGDRYLAVVNWHFHQSINRPGRSRIPPPPPPGIASPAPGEPGHCDPCWQAWIGSTGPLSTGNHGANSESSVNTHGALTTGREGNGREGKGSAGARANPAATAAPAPPDPTPEPPLKCPKHLDDPNPPPCGSCADARRAHDRWETDRAARVAGAAKCRRHRGQLAANCALCRSEQLAREAS